MRKKAYRKQFYTQVSLPAVDHMWLIWCVLGTSVIPEYEHISVKRDR